MTMRFATAADLEPIVALALANADRFARHGGCNEAKIRRKAADTIAAGRAAVVERDGAIVGSIGLEPYRPWHGDQVMLTNLWLYTAPGHRSFAAWRSLLALARAVAEETGVPLVLTFDDYAMPERKHRLFGRAGERLLQAWRFVPVGGEYLMTEPAP